MYRLIRSLLLGCLVLSCGKALVAAGPVRLKLEQAAGTVAGYTLQLRVQGDLTVPSPKGAPPQSIPLQVNGNLKFDERRVDDGSLPDELRSLRHYHEARAVIRIDRESNIVKLRPAVSLVRVRANAKQLQLLSTREPLTREERDLLDMPCDPLTLATLLPASKVKLNETWSIPAAGLAPLLTWDEVKRSDLVGKLIESDEEATVVEITGKATGQALGAPTAVELSGTLTLNRATGALREWKFELKEHRDPGAVSPGMKLTAEMSGRAEMLTESQPLTDDSLQGLALVDEQQPALLGYTQRQAVYRFRYDSRWRVVMDESQQLSMRLMDRGTMVAHANFKLLQLGEDAPPMPIKEFSEEVRATLGNRFTRFQDQTEGTNPLGARTLKVVAEGTVDDVSILWVSYLFEGPAGNRVSVTIAFEDKLLEQFENADQAILETLEFARVEQARQAEPVVK